MIFQTSRELCSVLIFQGVNTQGFFFVAHFFLQTEASLFRGLEEFLSG